MLYLTGTTISSVDLAHYGVSRAEDWVSVDCGGCISIATNVTVEFWQKELYFLIYFFSTFFMTDRRA